MPLPWQCKCKIIIIEKHGILLIADLVAAGAIIFFNNKINKHVKPNMFIIIVGALSISSGLRKFEARKLINTMW